MLCLSSLRGQCVASAGPIYDMFAVPEGLMMDVVCLLPSLVSEGLMCWVYRSMCCADRSEGLIRCVYCPCGDNVLCLPSLRARYVVFAVPAGLMCLITVPKGLMCWCLPSLRADVLCLLSLGD